MSSERPTVSLGFTTGQFPVGVHVCQIYRDEQERQDSLLRFLLAGMQAGECARCISDRTSEGGLSDFLAAHGISLAAARASGAMGLAPARETYLGEGRFDPERTLGALCRYHEEAVRQGFPSARVIGEMSPDVLHAPGGSRLLEYEARVSILLREHPVTAVCQYDAGAFSGATLMDVLTVHPLMVVRGSVVHNPFFIPPEQFLATRAGRA